MWHHSYTDFIEEYQYAVTPTVFQNGEFDMHVGSAHSLPINTTNDELDSGASAPVFRATVDHRVFSSMSSAPKSLGGIYEVAIKKIGFDKISKATEKQFLQALHNTNPENSHITQPYTGFTCDNTYYFISECGSDDLETYYKESEAPRGLVAIAWLREQMLGFPTALSSIHNLGPGSTITYHHNIQPSTIILLHTSDPYSIMQFTDWDLASVEPLTPSGGSPEVKVNGGRSYQPP
ncbi:hypothetical protein ACN47E_004706 [Coniothyrium glycines]